jgi:hypothetical protein
VQDKTLPLTIGPPDKIDYTAAWLRFHVGLSATPPPAPPQENTPDSLATPARPVLAPRPIDLAHPPARSSIVCSEIDSKLRIRIPALGAAAFFSKDAGLIFLVVWFLILPLAGMVLFWNAAHAGHRASAEPAVLVMSFFFGGLSLVPLYLLYRISRELLRRAVTETLITLDNDSLRIQSRTPRRATTIEHPRSAIDNVHATLSDTPVNDTRNSTDSQTAKADPAKVLELLISGAQPLRVLEDRPPREVEWVAAKLRAALKLPEEKQRAQHWLNSAPPFSTDGALPYAPEPHDDVIPERSPGMLRIFVPPRSLKGLARTLPFHITCAWWFFFVCISPVVWRSRVPKGFVPFLLIFVVGGMGLLIRLYDSLLRRATIEVTLDTIRVVSRGPFGQREQSWPASAITDILLHKALDPSLSLLTIDGRTTLLLNSDLPILESTLTHLRPALGLTSA